LDVRDVAEFMITMAEQKKVGKYNAVGPKDYENMKDFVKRAEKAFDVESSYVYVDDNEFLEENGMPILAPWIPAIGGNFGTSKISNAAALEAGLKLRPLADIVKDTYDWWISDQLTDENRKAFSARSQKLLDNEAEVLKKWKAL
jgi:2'-hydroxyisoflavone reductase